MTIHLYQEKYHLCLDQLIKDNQLLPTFQDPAIQLLHLLPLLYRFTIHVSQTYLCFGQDDAIRMLAIQQITQCTFVLSDLMALSRQLNHGLTTDQPHAYTITIQLFAKEAEHLSLPTMETHYLAVSLRTIQETKSLIELLENAPHPITYCLESVQDDLQQRLLLIKKRRYPKTSSLLDQ